MILLLDNYDSFVHNLARYFQRLGQQTQVVRSDAIDPAGVLALRPAAVVLSPGPCTPREAGCSVDVVRKLGSQLPVLGICLGHQAIAAAFGGAIVRAPSPFHGRSTPIQHTQEGVFHDVPNPISVCRYHSLVVDRATLPQALRVTATTADGLVMAIQHETAPVVGLQFHPEAILTEHGYRLLANFLSLAGLSAGDLPTMESERIGAPAVTKRLPNRPVTF
jgi:anthranilate synthase/aminodeoxychorismate synthase-like glutamine amidotransferase